MSAVPGIPRDADYLGAMIVPTAGESHYECFLALKASPAKVYDALTTPEGLRAWWTSTADVGTGVGSESTFRFGQTYNMMRIEALVPGKEVRWKCVAQDHHAPEKFSKRDEWVGTTVVFRLSPGAAGGTDLHFEHIGLVPALECFEICRLGWNHFLRVSLKAFVEAGAGQPFTG